MLNKLYKLFFGLVCSIAIILQRILHFSIFAEKVSVIINIYHFSMLNLFIKMPNQGILVLKKFMKNSAQIS